MEYRLSAQARVDLASIARYTLHSWGERQVYQYLSDLRAKFGLLAENPGLGKIAVVGKQGTRQIQQGSHIIYYRETRGLLVIQRVLHKRMLAGKQIS